MFCLSYVELPELPVGLRISEKANFTRLTPSTGSSASPGAIKYSATLAILTPIRLPDYRCCQETSTCDKLPDDIEVISQVVGSQNGLNEHIEPLDNSQARRHGHSTPETSDERHSTQNK